MILWALGALILLTAIYVFGIRLRRIEYYYTALRILFGLFVLVPFIIAYRSQRAGVVAALLYIPLIVGIPYLARHFGVYEVFGLFL